ncbi:YadA-like family protein [Vibrio sp. 1CM24A]|uniref:YadA-like family protein n=1 Tax=Vibrio sp. 1CM24A TaxID=2929165 RepID=UPI0020BE15E2|nr:YadA-like family protein [Vibrio sp. 1CM24A]MCK8081413.1 YadA-like family protein [Vibrio sp. 1CM24A]
MKKSILAVSLAAAFSVPAMAQTAPQATPDAFPQLTPVRVPVDHYATGQRTPVMHPQATPMAYPTAIQQIPVKQSIPTATPYAYPNAIPVKQAVPTATPYAIPNAIPVMQTTPQAIPNAIPNAIPVKQEIPTATPYIYPKMPQQTPVLQTTPHAYPNAIPVKQEVPTATPYIFPKMPQQTPVLQTTPQAIPNAIPTAIPVKQEVPTAVPYIHPKLPQQVPVAIPVDQYATGQKTPVMHNIPQATPNAIPTVPQQTPPRIQEATHLDRPAEASHLDAQNHRQPDNAVHADNPFRHYNSITADGAEQSLAGAPAQNVTLRATTSNTWTDTYTPAKFTPLDTSQNVHAIPDTNVMPTTAVLTNQKVPTPVPNAQPGQVPVKTPQQIKQETPTLQAIPNAQPGQVPVKTPQQIKQETPTQQAIPNAQPGQVPVKTPQIQQVEPQPSISKIGKQTSDNTADLYNQGRTIKSQGNAIRSNTHSIQDLQAKTNKNEQDIKDLRSDFERQAKELDGVAATAGAFAGLVDPYGVGKTNATVGLGYHGDAQAIAVGVGRRWNEQFTTKLGGAYDTGSESATLYAGAAYEW